MAESSWNFQFLPPRAYPYSASETFHMLVHSIKASETCRGSLKVFSSCRKTPEGKYADPEKCQPLAEDLISCFSSVRSVPEQCQASFNQVISCLEKGKKCDALLSEYLACPSSK